MRNKMVKKVLKDYSEERKKKIKKKTITNVLDMYSEFYDRYII
jgi:hypothetical protein